MPARKLLIQRQVCLDSVRERLPLRNMRLCPLSVDPVGKEPNWAFDVQPYFLRSRTKSALADLCNHLAVTLFSGDSWIARNQFERAPEQFFSRRNLVPGRRA